VVKYFRVFRHVGFFNFRYFGTTAIIRENPDQPQKGVTIMSGKTDVVKGRIKEAAGTLVGNEKLRKDGKTDQAVGKVKQIAEKAVDKVERAVKKVRE
jgi:uncharacterized protein YjbJ (UPF0337 family)